LSTKLKKRHAGALLAGLTLSIAILAALLPGWAEAQEVDTNAVSIETAQDTNNNQTNSAADEAITTAATTSTMTTSTMTTSTVSMSQSAYEPAAVLVIEPGDSLWAIAQERLGPEATPQRVAEETGRIYGLNRERIGDDPNLIFPGQELLVAQGLEPAADVSPTTGVATEPAAQEPAAQEPAAQEEPATAEQPTAEQPTAADEEALPDPTQDESAAENDEPSYPLPYYSGRLAPGMLTLLISLGFFLGALAVAALAVARLRRRRRLLGGRYGPSYEPSDRQEHDRPRQPEREADKKPAPDVPGPTAEVREKTSEKE
jgi:LysM repeat protein